MRLNQVDIVMMDYVDEMWKGMKNITVKSGYGYGLIISFYTYIQT